VAAPPFAQVEQCYIYRVYDAVIIFPSVTY